MLERTESVVLKKIKYSDNSVILHLFTREAGRVSCIVRGIRSKKPGFAPSLFQPFIVLDTLLYRNPRKELAVLKEVSLAGGIVDRSTSANVILMFLSEFIDKVIRYQHTDRALFDFIKTSLISYGENNHPCFLLLFLTGMVRQMGLSPLNNYTIRNPYFDIFNAQFVSAMSGTQTSDIDTSRNFHFLLSGETVCLPEINNRQKIALLSMLLKYFAIHTGTNINVNSFNVLSEILY